MVVSVVADFRTPAMQHIDLLLNELMLAPHDGQRIKRSFDGEIGVSFCEFGPDSHSTLGVDASILKKGKLIWMRVIKSHYDGRRSWRKVHSISDVFGNRYRTKSHLIQVLQILFEFGRGSKHCIGSFANVMVHHHKNLAVEVGLSLSHSWNKVFDFVERRKNNALVVKNDACDEINQFGGNASETLFYNESKSLKEVGHPGHYCARQSVGSNTDGCFSENDSNFKRKSIKSWLDVVWSEGIGQFLMSCIASSGVMRCEYLGVAGQCP